jgi:hypothetical protein
MAVHLRRSFAALCIVKLCQFLNTIIISYLENYSADNCTVLIQQVYGFDTVILS